MISKEVEITFRVKPEQAAALLEFLSCVLRADIMRALDSPEQVQAFDFASERLRVALRKVVEPDVGVCRGYPWREIASTPGAIGEED